MVSIKNLKNFLNNDLLMKITPQKNPKFLEFTFFSRRALINFNILQFFEGENAVACTVPKGNWYNIVVDVEPIYGRGVVTCISNKLSYIGLCLMPKYIIEFSKGFTYEITIKYYMYSLKKNTFFDKPTLCTYKDKVLIKKFNFFIDF